MKEEKFPAEDLEKGDCIWVDKFDEYKLIKKIDSNLNFDVVVTFDTGETIFLKKNQKVILM